MVEYVFLLQGPLTCFYLQLSAVINATTNSWLNENFNNSQIWIRCEKDADCAEQLRSLATSGSVP